MSDLSALLKELGTKVVAAVGIFYISFGLFVYWQADPGSKLSLFMFEFSKSRGTHPRKVASLPSPIGEEKRAPDELEAACRESLTLSAEEEADLLTSQTTREPSVEPRVLCKRNYLAKKTLAAKVLFGRALVVEGKDIEARAIFEETAEQGEPHAHLVLGFVYSNYTDREPTKALNNFLKAYIRGEPYGAYGLGKYLELGMHDMPDYSLAAVMYEIAAEANVTEAQFRLGQLYQFGLGVPQSDELATKYLRRAAASGNEAAIQILGGSYEQRN